MHKLREKIYEIIEWDEVCDDELLANCGGKTCGACRTDQIMDLFTQTRKAELLAMLPVDISKIKKYSSYERWHMANGWNACIDEIKSRIERGGEVKKLDIFPTGFAEAISSISDKINEIVEWINDYELTKECGAWTILF